MSESRQTRHNRAKSLASLASLADPLPVTVTHDGRHFVVQHRSDTSVTYYRGRFEVIVAYLEGARHGLMWPNGHEVAAVTGLHPSHVTRISDASSFDIICVHCGATDHVPGGWGRLGQPCPKAPAEGSEP